MTPNPPEEPHEHDRGETFDAWFPRVQRVVVLSLGSGGVVYSTVTKAIEYLPIFGGFLLWEGYQALRRAGKE